MSKQSHIKLNAATRGFNADLDQWYPTGIGLS